MGGENLPRERLLDRLGWLLRREFDLLPVRRHVRRGPQVNRFRPPTGRAGCQVDIEGLGFAAVRADNQVTIGGQPALVVAASPTGLKVITDPETVNGPVEVVVGGQTGRAGQDFRVLGYPGVSEDGPPILFAGVGEGLPGDVPPTGTSKVLVALVNPTDRVPQGSAARTTIVNRWKSVQDFYKQASFGTKALTVDVAASWKTLTGATNDYCDLSKPVENIMKTARDRLVAEAAQACQDAGHKLGDYDVFAVTLFLNGAFIRALGGWSAQSFSYDPGPGGAKISITLSKALNLLAVNETANWGRLAHEVGHNIVSAPGTLPQVKTKNDQLVFGEDVYQSDLVDPQAATAHQFDMMGDHDNHPLFSAYYMERLGWYRADNAAHDQDVLDLTWNRNHAVKEVEIVAHGGTRNTVANRWHAVKIKVASGLFYYVEVRQRPGTVVFDDSIPVPAQKDGGVIITKVVTDTVHNNQQERFITLLHDPVALKAGDIAVDPARALTITVLNDAVVTRPLVCRVKIEWAAGIADDPKGAFDLSITPWDGTYTSPDIWVDRSDDGKYDHKLDAQGRPELNGDKPKPGEINKLYARINNSGTVAASNVKVTFYVVEPPGVGDNGNWSPLITRTVGAIAKNDHVDVTANWVPLVGKHTCLRIYIGNQFGEVSGGNNWAQENVSDFESPAFSPPAPVVAPDRDPQPRRRGPRFGAGDQCLRRRGH